MPLIIPKVTVRKAELLIHAIKTQKIIEGDLTLDDRLTKASRKQHKENIKVYNSLIVKWKDATLTL